jgi:NhaA family Na+:H+ antiporter
MIDDSLLSAAARPFRALFASDAREGVLLIAITVAALAVANSSFSEAYHALFHGRLAWSPIAKLDTVHLWINDAVMALFFFVVGLEVKREIVEGELSDAQHLRLPVMAAFAGMAVPAAIYVLIAGDDPLLDRGWAIPAATDIAFAMGVIGLLGGDRVPRPLRLFLLTVAIVDDIGAVLIIAFFYTDAVHIGWLFAALLFAAVLVLLNWRRVDRLPVYLIAGAALWLCVLHSGVHATIAGVVTALAVPMRRADGTPLLESLEHALVGWNAYLVVPLFAFANAGVDVRAIGLAGFAEPLPLAIAAGLVVGKQVGVAGAVLLGAKLGLAPRPPGASWLQVWGVSVLCGIGFTMSLFIGTMGFADYPELYEQAKLGVLAGTFISLVAGYAILRLAPATASAQD